MNIRISDTKDYFEVDNKPFFYFADTVWSAFTNITPEEWEEYLDFRRTQGFNVLQINILPQWDSSDSSYKIDAFLNGENGKPDYFQVNPEYFERAQQMLEVAVSKGFIPALVVLWCNHVPDTWLSKKRPEEVMPLEAVKKYVEYVATIFSRFNPIFIASGDTNFESEETVIYYTEVLKILKKICPAALTTMHLWGDSDYLPEQFEKNEYLDFYMYQSGHALQNQNVEPWRMAETFLKKSIKRPIVNGEPCYEAMGVKGGRHTALNVRQAVWESLLSGAKAGITYGAHGIWNWHKKGNNYTEFMYSMPMDCRAALRLEGAWDISFAKWIFETYKLNSIVPIDIIVKNEVNEIRASITKDKSNIIIYAPYCIDINVNMDLSNYDWRTIYLCDRKIASPGIDNKEGAFVISMDDCNSDVLIIGTIKKQTKLCLF